MAGRELKKQSELDAAALNLAYRQLNPSPDLPEVTQDALDTAIAAASRPTKVQVFNQAWKVRGRDPRDKPKMERTIPVFRALVHNDVENRYHMNHGQLSFALKDKIHGWLFYELNRAICRIMSDPALPQDHPSAPDRMARILDDLRAAAHAEDMGPILRTDP